MKRLLLALALMYLVVFPARAAQTIYPIDVGDVHKLVFTAGGAFLNEQYINLAKPSLFTAADSSVTYPLNGTHGDTASTYAARTITFTDAQNDSLLVGGVCARTLKVWLQAKTDGNISPTDITIIGKNAMGQTITEDLAVTENTELDGQSGYAYKSITSVLIPAQDGAVNGNVRFFFGRGSGIGFPFTTGTNPIIRRSYGYTDGNTVQIETSTDTLQTSTTDIEDCWFKPVYGAQPSADWQFLFWIPRFQGTGTAGSRGSYVPNRF
jgi:hypothetical protein